PPRRAAPLQPSNDPFAALGRQVNFLSASTTRERFALMTKAKYLVGEPGVDGAAQLVEFAGKEMIDAFDDNKMIAAVERGDKRSYFFDGAVFVIASMHEQLRFVALAQE